MTSLPIGSLPFYLARRRLGDGLRAGHIPGWRQQSRGRATDDAGPDAEGRRKHRHFQWLTSNVGYPKLREHLGAVVATMKLSTDWHDFRAKLDKNYPRKGKPTQLSFDYSDDDAEDDGKGL